MIQRFVVLIFVHLQNWATQPYRRMKMIMLKDTLWQEYFLCVHFWRLLLFSLWWTHCQGKKTIWIFRLVRKLRVIGCRYGEQKREGSAKNLIFATFDQMKNPTQLLLIPLTVWSGMEQGFFSSDYTAVSYIDCYF